MKKTIKNIIICVAITYLILSLAYTVLQQGITKEKMQIIEENEMYKKTYKEMMWDDIRLCDVKINDISEQMNIYQSYIYIAIISLCIGGIVGLTVSTKENTIAKYILLYIMGNVLYSIIWALIAISINKEMGNNWITFNKALANISTIAFISYTLIYSVVILGVIHYNKKKVEELNNSLKNKVQENKSKNIPIHKILIILIIIIIVFFIGNTIRKTVILINYSKAVYKLDNKNDFYVEEEIIGTDGNKNYFKIYYKDEKLYFNGSDNELVQLPIEAKTTFKIYTNKFLGDCKISIWRNIELALKTRIKSEKYNGKNCYVIRAKDDFDYMNKTYIDKETYLVIRILDYSHGIKREEYQETNITYGYGIQPD